MENDKNTKELFKIETEHNNNNVCKMDSMLFLLSFTIIIIILYIIHFRTK
jgi:hypothetical protein